MPVTYEDGEARVKPGGSRQCQAEKIATEMKRIGQALKQRGIDTALTNPKLASDFAAKSPKLHVPKLKLNLAGRNMNGTKKEPTPPPPEEPEPPPRNLVEKLDRFLLLDLEGGDGVKVPEPRPFFGPGSLTPEPGAQRDAYGEGAGTDPSGGRLRGHDFFPPIGMGMGVGAPAEDPSGAPASVSPGRGERQPHQYQPYQRQPRPPHLTLVFPLDLAALAPPEITDLASLREPESWDRAGALATLAAARGGASSLRGPQQESASGSWAGAGAGLGAGAGTGTEAAVGTGAGSTEGGTGARSVTPNGDAVGGEAATGMLPGPGDGATVGEGGAAKSRKQVKIADT